MNKPTTIVITPSVLNSAQPPIISTVKVGTSVSMAKAIKNPGAVSPTINLQHSAKAAKRK